MVDLSLADFIDIASKSGISKTNAILRIKNRPPYHPAFDYYKSIREHIIELHKTNGGKKDMLDFKELTTDAKKWEAYSMLLSCYKKFLGRKTIIWFQPPRDGWQANEINVLLNPELGLIINNIPHVIKLYMKADTLSKEKSVISLFLMHQSLPKMHDNQPINYSILDIRRNNLIKTNSFPGNILSSLTAEAAYINSIWNTKQ
jgi:hypothetical protein